MQACAARRIFGQNALHLWRAATHRTERGAHDRQQADAHALSHGLLCKRDFIDAEWTVHADVLLTLWPAQAPLGLAVFPAKEHALAARELGERLRMSVLLQ